VKQIGRDEQQLRVAEAFAPLLQPRRDALAQISIKVVVLAE
jgi:hypothetical protein